MAKNIKLVQKNIEQGKTRHLGKDVKILKRSWKSYIERKAEAYQYRLDLDTEKDDETSAQIKLLKDSFAASKSQIKASKVAEYGSLIDSNLFEESALNQPSLHKESSSESISAAQNDTHHQPDIAREIDANNRIWEERFNREN